MASSTPSASSLKARQELAERATVIRLRIWPRNGGDCQDESQDHEANVDNGMVILMTTAMMTTKTENAGLLAMLML